jgi:hypothetical protein
MKKKESVKRKYVEEAVMYQIDLATEQAFCQPWAF